jgi:hypothetical protein
VTDKHRLADRLAILTEAADHLEVLLGDADFHKLPPNLQALAVLQIDRAGASLRTLAESLEDGLAAVAPRKPNGRLPGSRQPYQKAGGPRRRTPPGGPEMGALEDD